MARLVMKFGGVSVADGKRLRHVGEMAKQFRDQGNEVVIITSALQGVTDQLLECAKKAANEGDTAEVEAFIKRLTERHNQSAADAIRDPDILKEVQEITANNLKDLEKAYTGICYLGEISPRSLDYISGYGEQLAAPILAGVIRDLGIESKAYTGGDAGIITNSDYGDAKPLDKTYGLVAERLMPLQGIPVITGFIAKDEKGTITTLGRGGSDFSASIIGAAIGADEIWFWKETQGILTTDPKVVPEAKTIPVISYKEAMELSFFGAKVLHPRAIEPAIKKEIPVRVKCTFDITSPGTQIVPNDVPKKDVIKAVTLAKNVALLNLSGAGMIGSPGVAARAFTAMAKAGVNIIMISQSSSEANISMVVDARHLEKAETALISELPNDLVKEVSHDQKIAVVAVVGSGMAGAPGVAARVFMAIGEANINVMMISQAVSEHNISFVVRSEDAERAVQVLHREFELHGGSS